MRRLAIASLVCAVMLAAGIVMIIVGAQNLALPIALVSMGVLLGLIFFSCFLAERGRALVIDEEKVVFARGAQKDGRLVLKKTVVRLDEILSFESALCNGDGLVSGKTCFRTLTLKDGVKITVTLYAYGMDAEKEIAETLYGIAKKNMEAER